eukprot:g6683.t1
MPEINAERLLADLRELRTFGAAPNHPLGVIRPSYSEADMAAREWLCDKLRQAGLDAEIDGVGNVLGRSRRPGRAVLLGSHTDTQPNGGWLDGAMGVVYALEVARALAQDPATAALPVDVASFVDEEATYMGFLGSRSFCGELDEAAAAAAVGNAGATGSEPLPDALRRAGLAGRPRLRLGSAKQGLRGRYAAFLEAHIEQGPALERAGLHVGVVTGIVGLRGAVLSLEGEQNHAGTTPMALRRDAGMAALRLGAAVDAAFRRAASETSVWTFGEVAFEPGSHSIVPGRARMMLQWRDQDAAVLARMEAALQRLIDAANAEAGAAAGGGVRVSLEWQDRKTGVQCDDALMRVLDVAAERRAPGKWCRMPSGAAHDAQVLALHMPTAMLFVPSIGGVSHNFAEDTCDADLVRGCAVFADATAEVARRANSSKL